MADARTALLGAACRAVRRHGLAQVRIADIAAEACVSTGLVHYHFAGKDDVLRAAFRWTSDQLFARVETELAGAPDGVARIGRLLALCVPRAGITEDSYAIWMEYWARLLHRRDLLAECEAVSRRWHGYFTETVRAGAATGELAPVAAPDVVADRLAAIVDGFGFEVLAGYEWASAQRMRGRLVDFAAEQLGVEPGRLR